KWFRFQHRFARRRQVRQGAATRARFRRGQQARPRRRRRARSGLLNETAARREGGFPLVQVAEATWKARLRPGRQGVLAAQKRFLYKGILPPATPRGSDARGGRTS